MDPLVEIHPENWPAVRDTFKEWWPHGVAGYYALDTPIRQPLMTIAFKYTVYCPYGDIQSGVVMTLTKGAENQVVILPNTPDTTKLEEALLKTKVIEWCNVHSIPFADIDVVKLVRRIAGKVDLRIEVEGPTIKHYLNKNSKPYDVQCPENTYIGELKLEHVEHVNSVWPHRNSATLEFMEVLVKHGVNYALYSKEDNSLLAWMLINEVGFLTHLYTEDKHRGKGYGEFIAKYASNDQLKRGIDVFCYILEGNTASMKLFRKLEYEVIGRGVWFIIKNNKSLYKL